MTPREFYAQAPKETLTECPLCGDSDLLLNSRVDRYGLDAPSMRCWCGLVFLSPRMTAEAYREFYARGHYRELLAEFYGKPVGVESIEASQKPYSERLSRWLAPHVDPYSSGLLLDLGGSTGLVAERLAFDFDLDATVVEPSELEAQRARARGLTVASVPLEEFDPGGVRYDIVTLCQTVDHLLDIKGAFFHIGRWLKSGGLLFVDFVENAPIKVDHPFYLTRETMRLFLERSWFKIKLLEPAGDGLHVNALAVLP